MNAPLRTIPAAGRQDRPSPLPPPATAAARWRLRYPGLTAAAALVGLLALIPLGFVLAVTVEVGWETATAMLFRARVGDLLANTLALEAAAIPAALALAATLAWLTERTDLPAARLWRALAVAPLAIPAFVQSYAWTDVAPGFHGFAAAVLVSVLAYFPFAYLPLAAQLRRLDPALEDVAASLGLSPWRAFFRAVLPQLRIALAGGALLIGLHLFAEYGLFALLRYDTFTTAIIDQFQSAYNGPAANMLAVVLVGSAALLLLLERVARGNARYARIGPGVARPRARRRLGRLLLPGLLFPLALAALSLGVPLATLGRWLAHGGGDVWQSARIGEALGDTVLLALAGGVLTTLAVLPIAWLSVRAPSPLQRAIEAAHYYVGSLPGVVVALSLVAISVRVARPLYQTAATLVFAYALLFLPRALVAVRGAIAQVPVDLEWAAAALGRTPRQTALQVTARLAAFGIVASMALVALAVTTELTATLLLAPNGTHTLATEFWSLTSELDYAAAAPYALLMVLASLPMTVLLHAQARRAAGE